MEKSIKVGKKTVKLKTSAALPRLYRLKFNRDIFVDFEKLANAMSQSTENGLSTIPVECLSIFEEIAYIMAKYADESVPDDINKWLDKFETFDIYTIIPHIIEMWNVENVTTSEAKKKNAKQPAK